MKKMANKIGKLRIFLERNMVFTMGEFREFFSISDGAREAYDSLLHQKKMGRIGRIKDGLYFVIRPGGNSIDTVVDPYLIASKLSYGAVLAYHTALELLGYGHSSFSTFYYFSDRYHPVLRFQGNEFRAVTLPVGLRKSGHPHFNTEKIERRGAKLSVSGVERTMVDVLERPQYCAGLEEVYRSLEKIPYIRPRVLLEYLEFRNQRNLYGIVGFFLEQHREIFHPEPSFLKELAEHAPAQPMYWSPKRQGGVLVHPWNLIVPEAAARRTWEDR